MIEAFRRDSNRARAFRRAATPAERKLWTVISNRKAAGAKFARQIQIGPFYGDFVCREHKLVIELDGQGHDQSVLGDERRTRWLEQRGYRVLRFANEQVFLDLDAVLTKIAVTLATLPTPAFGHPSREREGS